MSRWQRFKASRTGYVSLWVFMTLFGLSMCAELIANDKPWIVRYEGHFYFPIAHNQAETVFGGDFATPTDFLDPDIFVGTLQVTVIGRFIHQFNRATKHSITFHKCRTLRHLLGITGLALMIVGAMSWRA